MKKPTKEKKPKPEKPYNSNQWTEARFRSFIMSALRRAQWPQKFKAISTVYIKDGINPKTGKKCKLHQCPICKEILPKGSFHSDHINPVVPLDNNWANEENFLGYNWNKLLPNLFCESDKYQPICKVCHAQKSKEENLIRKQKRLCEKSKLQP